RSPQEVGEAAADAGRSRVAIAAPGQVVREGALGKDDGGAELVVDPAADASANQGNAGVAVVVVAPLRQIVAERATVDLRDTAGQDAAASRIARGLVG